MAEPAFYQCTQCEHAWERTEWRTRPNRPPICPQCNSAEQTSDHAREDMYLRQTYESLAKHVGALLNKKLKAVKDPK